MALLKKKKDPISERARMLTGQIAELEAEIQKLDSQLQTTSGPKFRSTALPQTGSVFRPAERPAAVRSAHEPVFEVIPAANIKARGETESPDHYNDLGVRKYDLPALWQRIANHLRGPSSSNPRLLTYLAAGGVQGLRPMRYEKRVARNRVIALATVLFLILLGTLITWLKQH